MRAHPPLISLRQLAWATIASLVFVPLAFWGASFDEVSRIVQQANWQPLVVAALVGTLAQAAKAARWQLFFPTRPTFTSAFAALIIGQVVNWLLPARLGDVARVVVLRRRAAERAARIVGTIGAEKLVELIALFAFALAVAPFVPLPVWLLDPSLRLSVVLLGGILLLSIVFLQQARLRRWGAWLGATWLRVESARVERQFDLTVEGFAPLRQRARVVKIFAWSLLVWGLMAATNFIVFLALPLPASWLTAVVLLLVLQVGVAVPTTPGKIGVFQALVTLTLALFGIGRELALGYGLLLYFVVVVPQLVCAGPFIWQEVMRLRRPRVVGAKHLPVNLQSD